MEAGKILLVASGESKKSAVKRAIEGPITEDCPGSVLQLHPDATAIIDERAAERLDSSLISGLPK